MKQVEVPKEQSFDNYLVVRTHLVHVRKSWMGFHEKELSMSNVIPNTVEEALDLFKKIAEENLKYGKAFREIEGK